MTKFSAQLQQGVGTGSATIGGNVVPFNCKEVGLGSASC